MGVVLMSKQELNRIDVLARRSVGNCARRFHGLNGCVKRPHFEPSRSRAILPRTLLREQTGQIIDARTANFINLPG